LQCDRNGLIYCIYDLSSLKIIVFRKYRFEHVYLASDMVRQIIGILDKDDILKLPFHGVRFMGFTQQSTLIPAAFFNGDKLQDYLDFNVAGGSEGEIFSNLIKYYETYNIFALPRSLVSLITLHFKKVEFSNQTTPFLCHLPHDASSRNKPQLHVSLNSDFFDLAVTGNEKLILYNTFQYANETDLLYYILYVCKQLALDIRETHLVLSGEMSSRMIYYDILKQYLPATSYNAAFDLPGLSTGLQPLVPYKFINLLYLNNCVLSAENIKEEK
jgi:hypothetical protein